MDEAATGPVERTRPTESGSEWETLTQLLDFLRETVAYKCMGLSDAQAFDHPVPASDLTMAGIVKHLTGVERFWFSIDFADHGVPWPWTDEDPHGAFRLEATDTLATLLAAYQLECDRSRRAVADEPLDRVAKSEGMDFTLRYGLAHMIEETARHCGHLDLLRESLDGARGE